MAASPAASTFAPCRLRGLEHEALCGVLKRPLDPARPNGVQIDLHYAVVPALARNKKADPVFFFAGGPGQSAIDLAGPVAGQLNRFLNRRDLVLIDQRGTGRSAPLDCSVDDPALPLAQTLDPARQVSRMAACRVALQKLPYGDLRFFTTVIASQDADAVRAALGADVIDAIGVSYGTRAVLDYMRQFPQHVRRAVIDGVAPPDMVLPAAFSTDNQAALDELFDACAKEPNCANRHPQLRMHWEQLLQSLADSASNSTGMSAASSPAHAGSHANDAVGNSPTQVTLIHPVTGRAEPVTMTRDMLLAMVRLPLYIPALAAALPQAIDDATRQHYETLAALDSLLQGRSKELALAEGMHFSIVCSEDVPHMGTDTQDPPGIDFGDAFARQYRDVCATWPHGQVPADFYRVPPARAATLVLSGASDPVTPPRHAAQVAKALGAKAKQVVVPNAGHGVGSLGCMRDVVFHFVDAASDDDALKLPADCAAHVPRPPAFAPIEPPPGASAPGALPAALSSAWHVASPRAAPGAVHGAVAQAGMPGAVSLSAEVAR